MTAPEIVIGVLILGFAVGATYAIRKGQPQAALALWALEAQARLARAREWARRRYRKDEE